MMRRRSILCAAACAWLAACGGEGQVGPAITMPDAAAHAASFPIAPGDTHGPATGATSAACNACHVDLATGQPSASFTTFACTGCHVQVRETLWHDSVADVTAFHAAAGVAGFSPDAASCLRCHPTGLAVDHARRFPLPHQNAAATVVAKCADCHVDPANRLLLGCAGCHADTAPVATGHAGVPDFVPADTDAAHSASALCLRCHAENTVPVTVAGHPFPISGGVHSGAAGGRCLACHPALQAAPAKTWAADFARSTCVGCHVTVGGTGSSVHHDVAAELATLHGQATDASGVAFAILVADPPSPGGLGLDAACRRCHPDGSAAPANHPQLFPIGAGTSHAGVACAQCHVSSDRTDVSALACASCHAALTAPPSLAAAHSLTGYAITTYQTATVAGGTRATVQVDMTRGESCLRCHADGQVDRVASHPQGDSGFGKGEHRTAGCLTCHFRMRADKPWGANFGTATGAKGPPPSACYVCHSSGTG